MKKSPQKSSRENRALLISSVGDFTQHEEYIHRRLKLEITPAKRWITLRSTDDYVMHMMQYDVDGTHGVFKYVVFDRGLSTEHLYPSTVGVQYPTKKIITSLIQLWEAKYGNRNSFADTNKEIRLFSGTPYFIFTQHSKDACVELLSINDREVLKPYVNASLFRTDEDSGLTAIRLNWLQ